MSRGLTEKDVPEVRRLYRSGLSIRAIAGRKGVAYATIQQLLNGTTWGHVLDPKGPVVRRSNRDPMTRSKSDTKGGRKLDWAKAARIRRLRREGMLLREIADVFGITPKAVSLVCQGRRWKQEPPSS